MNSFIPSATGCNSPYGPTVLGPFRSCMYPNTFRSSNVKKATAIRIGIMYMSGGIRFDIRGFIIGEGN